MIYSRRFLEMGRRGKRWVWNAACCLVSHGQHSGSITIAIELSLVMAGDELYFQNVFSSMTGWRYSPRHEKYGGIEAINNRGTL